MPDLPDHLMIAGHEVAVVAVDDRSAGLAAHTKPNAIGSTDVEVGRVYVRTDPTQSISNQRDTLMHETVHYALILYGYLDRETDVFKSERMGERLVDVLGTALVDVLRRNPTLVQYLVAGTASDVQAAVRRERDRAIDLANDLRRHLTAGERDANETADQARATALRLIDEARMVLIAGAD